MRHMRFLSPKRVRRELDITQQNWLRQSIRNLDTLSTQRRAIHDARYESGDPETIKKLTDSQEVCESLVADIVRYTKAQLGLNIKKGESWVSVKRKIVTTYPDLLQKK